MTAQQKSTAIPMHPIYSGPRPDVDQENYEAQSRYLSELVKCFSPRFHAPNIATDPRVEQLFKEAIELRTLCEAFAQKASELRAQLTTEAGDGTVIDDPREILSLLPAHRVTSGPYQQRYYNGCRFKLAFKPEILPAIATYCDKAQYSLKQAIDTNLIGAHWLHCSTCDLTFCQKNDDRCQQCKQPMVAVADQHEAARLENKSLQDRLLPLKERGFMAWLRIEKVSRTHILATLVVSGR